MDVLRTQALPIAAQHPGSEGGHRTEQVPCPAAGCWCCLVTCYLACTHGVSSLDEAIDPLPTPGRYPSMFMLPVL